MYCANCGSQNDDQAMYCYKCGNPLKQQPWSRSVRRTGNRGGEAAAKYAQDRGIAGALYALIRSPLYLTAVIALSVQVFAGILGAAAGNSLYSSLLYSMINDSELAYYMDYGQINAIVNALGRSNVAGVVINNIPVIIIAAGLWLLYADAVNGTRKMSVTGITMIKVVEIIYLVLLGLGMVIGLIAAVAVLAGLSRYIDNAGIIIALIIIFFAVGGGVSIIYYLKIIKMLGSAQDIIVTGRKTAPAYLYVIVLTFISAGFQCISAFTALFSAGIFGFLASAASATSGIAFGLLMNRFNTLEAVGTEPRQIYAEVEMIPRHQDSYMNNGNRESEPEQQKPSVNIPPFIPPKPGTVVMQYNGEDELKKKYAEEGTMVLNDNFDLPPAKIVRIKDQKEYHITKTEFSIGKAMGNVDCFIDDNPAVSRKHAMIIFKEGNYYIIDTKSTNHVYINGQIIPVDTPVQLADGMKIRLADEIFDFSTNV